MVLSPMTESLRSVRLLESWRERHQLDFGWRLPINQR